MAQRIGITVDLEVSKWELEKQFKNTRDWKFTDPFDTIAEAIKWEKEKAVELKVKTVAHGKPPKNPIRKLKWYGFIFDHDGPK